MYVLIETIWQWCNTLIYNFLAPTGPPQSFTVTPRAWNMTFSWSPPAPTQHNGVITGYFSPVSLPVTKTAFPCSTQQQAPSHWEDLYQPPPTTAPSLPVTVKEVGRPHTWLLQHQMMVSIMCFSTLLSSNVVSAAAGWDWSESLSGMGSKCNFLIVWTIVMIHICTICRVLLQPIN